MKPKYYLIYHILIYHNVATGTGRRPVDTNGNLLTLIILNITDLTGELEDRNFIVTRGDSRVAMTITRNEYTVKFGRKNRFIIDDPCSPDSKMAYALTKPLKVGKTYNDEGVFSFVLQEVTTTNDDNLELGIADYYKHFEFIPKDEPYEPKKEPNISPDDSTTESGKKVWL